MAPTFEPVDLAQVGLIGDQEFLDEIVALFISTATAHLAALRVALDNRDAKELSRVAHTLKGSSVAVFAGPMAQLAGALEIAGREAKLDSAPELLSRLNAMFAITAAQLLGASSTES
jgi:HPt (histidine-containing phosphotransfer) domain-containing protein